MDSPKRKVYKTKKEEYIDILLDGSYDTSDLTYLNSLTTEQLRGLVTREDDELTVDPELVNFEE